VNDLEMKVKGSNFHITWRSPFTFFQDSIEYCIKIVTQVSRHIIQKQCSLKVLSIDYFDIDYNTLYEATVTPYNRVGYGTSSSVFPLLSGVLQFEV